MPPKNSENGSSEASSIDYLNDLDGMAKTALRIASLFHTFTRKPFSGDLSKLEETCKPAKEQEDKIRGLEETLATMIELKDKKVNQLMEGKDGEIDRLKKENETLKLKAVEVVELEKKAKRERLEVQKEKTKTDERLKVERRELAESNKKKLEKMKTEFEKKHQEKVSKAEAEIKGELDKLKQEKQVLEEKNKELGQKLKEELGDKNRMIRQLKTENKGMQERLDTFESDLEAAKKAPSVYIDRISEMSRRLTNFAERYFSALPKRMELETGLLSKKTALAKASSLFSYALVAETERSIFLRKAAVRHFVCKEVVRILQQPFIIPQALDNSPGEKILHKIYSSLGPYDKAVWKAITVKATDKFPEFTVEAHATRAADNAIEKLHDLIEANGDPIRDDLTGIFQMALGIWNDKRKDSCKITVNAPGPQNDGSWGTEEEPYRFPGNLFHDADKGSPVVSERLESYAIFPQITGQFEADDEDGEQKLVTLHKGIALFSNSPVLKDALADLEVLKREVKGLHQRNTSISSPTRPNVVVPNGL
ncbi:hypothetical protein AJ80_05627 [Polytolypa hystricis UAMH7299]|uniref:Uncharacterized protein n=1 Tax=Polytolypa hystricis (strain UAMH7299) TaxID=1447883 RepID=A0A2B7XU32_POLH7|nr:hypothetical protein AJ80_05627 [Polytolypa hystricis UAMH7299]